jgi:hypothetical protein
VAVWLGICTSTSCAIPQIFLFLIQGNYFTNQPIAVLENSPVYTSLHILSVSVFEHPLAGNGSSGIQARIYKQESLRSPKATAPTKLTFDE